LVFGLWGAPVALLIFSFGSGWFLTFELNFFGGGDLVWWWVVGDSKV